LLELTASDNYLGIYYYRWQQIISIHINIIRCIEVKVVFYSD